MLKDIVKLIISEAQGENAPPLPAALRQIMLDVDNVIDSKVTDIAAVSKMQIPDQEKLRIIKMILQSD